MCSRTPCVVCTKPTTISLFYVYKNRNVSLIYIYTSNITLKCRAPYNIHLQKQHSTNTPQFVSIIFVVSEVSLYIQFMMCVDVIISCAVRCETCILHLDSIYKKNSNKKCQTIKAFLRILETSHAKHRSTTSESMYVSTLIRSKGTSTLP